MKDSPRMKVSSGSSSIKSRTVRQVTRPSLAPSRQSQSHTGSRCALGMRWKVCLGILFSPECCVLSAEWRKFPEGVGEGEVDGEGEGDDLAVHLVHGREDFQEEAEEAEGSDDH